MQPAKAVAAAVTNRTTTGNLPHLKLFAAQPFVCQNITVTLHCNGAFSKGVLLLSKRSPFTLQKGSFCTPKGVLSQGKRSPFENRQEKH